MRSGTLRWANAFATYAQLSAHKALRGATMRATAFDALTLTTAPTTHVAQSTASKKSALLMRSGTQLPASAFATYAQLSAHQALRGATMRATALHALTQTDAITLDATLARQKSVHHPTSSSTSRNANASVLSALTGALPA
jgi:hypothetical protein